MLGLLQIDEPRLETTRLQFVGYHGEHGQHRRHTVVRGVKQSSEDDAKDKAEQLLHAIVHPTPEEALRCFLLQTLTQVLTFNVGMFFIPPDCQASHPLWW